MAATAGSETLNRWASTSKVQRSPSCGQWAVRTSPSLLAFERPITPFPSTRAPSDCPQNARFHGFAFAVSPTLDLVTELLAPMIWVTGDQMVLSMNLSAEIAWRF